jgi:hypothetical protein
MTPSGSYTICAGVLRKVSVQDPQLGCKQSGLFSTPYVEANIVI